jgi:hypothetical protein
MKRSIKFLGALVSIAGSVLFLPVGHAGLQFGITALGHIPMVMLVITGLSQFIGLVCLPYQSYKNKEAGFHEYMIAFFSGVGMIISLVLAIVSYVVSDVFSKLETKPEELFVAHTSNTMALNAVESQFQAVKKQANCVGALCPQGLSKKILDGWRVIQSELFPNATAACLAAPAYKEKTDFCARVGAVSFDVAKPVAYAPYALAFTFFIMTILFIVASVTSCRKKCVGGARRICVPKNSRDQV